MRQTDGQGRDGLTVDGRGLHDIEDLGLFTIVPGHEDAVGFDAESMPPSQGGFGKFYERYVAAHGEPPSNDTVRTAKRLGCPGTDIPAMPGRTSPNAAGPGT